jgi:enoyl-CoA hydratase/carnithine racemase
MAYQHVIYEKKDRVAYVTIDRPHVMNALHRDAHLELIEVFDDFRDDDETWVAILTGAGDRAFCAGNDLKATAARNATGGEHDPAIRFGGITHSFACPKPIIAAVNGVAVGGGFEIALACDLIVAADHARFGLPEARVGMFAGSGGVHRLVRQVPLKQAMALLLTGRLVPADEALRLGLVNEVVPAADVMATAERWAQEILECSPTSIRLTKEAVDRGLPLGLEDAIGQDQEERIPRLIASEDFVEGPQAFAEKRPPRWTGR